MDHWPSAEKLFSVDAPQLDSVQKRRDLGALGPEWDVFLQSLPLWLRDLYAEEEEERLSGQREWHFADSTKQMHLWTHRDCDRTHKTCRSSSQTKSHYRAGKAVWWPTHSGEAIYKGYLPGERKISFLQWSTTGYQPHSRAGCMLTSSWPTQIGLHIF